MFTRTDRKCLMYASALMAFRAAARVVSDPQAMQKRLSSLPGVVVDGLFARFTETPRGSEQ
jgi:DNA-directed RNA polymerase I subunit RPA49